MTSSTPAQAIVTLLRSLPPRHKTWLKRLVLERSYAIDRTYYRLRFSTEFRRSNEILLIFSPGRCGSVTVLRSLERLHLETPIFNIHRMNRDRIRDYVPRPGPQAFLESYLAERLDRRWNDKQWKIIVLVREPIARQISLFAHVFFRDHPEAVTQYERGETTLNDLRKIFLRDHFHRSESATYTRASLLNWLDHEIKRVFGVDLYARAFPRELGYLLVEAPYLRILVVKTERLAMCWPEASERLLGRACGLVVTNRAAERSYYRVYRDLQESLVLPTWYLDEMHGSRYARHFYSEEELTAVRVQHAGRSAVGA